MTPEERRFFRQRTRHYLYAMLDKWRCEFNANQPINLKPAENEAALSVQNRCECGTMEPQQDGAGRACDSTGHLAPFRPSRKEA